MTSEKDVVQIIDAAINDIGGNLPDSACKKLIGLKKLIEDVFWERDDLLIALRHADND